jgi:hypothetical protein
MSEETLMRLRLQTVAAYRQLCRSVQRSGRENVFFALVMLGLAYYTFQPNAAGIAAVVFLLYAGLALAEFAAGLFKVLAPRAEGVLLDSFILLLFAGWNLGWQGLALWAGLAPNGVILVLGLYMLFGSFGRFRSYLTLRRLFAERPDPEHLAWFDELVHEIRTADPHTDDLVLDLPSRPRLKAKLLGATAFFVTTDGNAVLVAGPDDFTLRRDRVERAGGRRRARFSIHGAAYPEFDLDDASWSNYTKWLATQAPAHLVDSFPPPPATGF